MAGVKYQTPQQARTAAWAGDLFTHEHVLPGGDMLHAADFTADAKGRRFVESGTLLGRTMAERDAGQGYGPYAAGDTDVYLLLYDVRDANESPECALYRHGSLVYEGSLPDATKANLAVVRDHYQTVVV